jgi:hypothetical protein
MSCAAATCVPRWTTGSSCWPTARNPGTGEDPATATAQTLRAVDIELLHDAEHASRLVLPAMP